MSIAPAITLAERVAPRPGTQLELYREDGPLVRLVGVALGRRIPVRPLVLAVIGAAGLFAAIAVEGDGASDGVVAAAVAWFVLWAGLSAGRPHTDEFAWALPGVLRIGEYGALIWIGAIVGESGSAAAFALIAALAFRHYDLVYRSRIQGTPPAAWLDVATGGWDARMPLAVALLALGAVPEAFFAIAAVLGLVLVADSVRSWARHTAAPVSVYEDEEDEGD